MSLMKKISEFVHPDDHVDARKNIARLNKNIREYKEKVKHYIDANYKEFLPSIINNEQLLKEGSNLEEELYNVKQCMNSETMAMHEANDEISRHVEELEEVQIKLKLSLKLVQIDRCLEKIRQLNEAKAYAEVQGYVNKIQLLIDDPDDRIIRRLDVYQHLKMRLKSERKSLLKNLENRFKQLIQLKEKTFHKTKAITIVITKDLTALNEVTHAILDSEFDFKDIADFMMVNIFEPLVSRAVSSEFSENEGNVTMNMSYSIGPVSDDLRPNYTSVFTNLANLMVFLMSMNFELTNGDHLVPYILKNRYDDLMRLILNECLMHSIPKTFEEKSESTLAADIHRMNEILTNQLFFTPGEEKLEDYPAEIDRIFYKQFIKNMTDRASETLKRDLHDMVAISEDTTIATTTPLTFPRSMISKSVFELIRLLEKIIAEAQKCDEASREKKLNLLMAAKAVLENYPFAIQLHHSKFLSQIPQQSALFYNNCMYLSNWANNNQETKGIVGMEQVTKGLESQGWEILEVQIAKQEVQLIEVLSEFDPSQALNVVNPEVFKPVRQCLRQMDLLKNVWQTILPSTLYNKTIAGLLNVISSNFVNKVAVMEDISANLSTALVELIKTMDEKSQALFEADTSCLTIVDSWQRLLHLQFVLDASLIDISASWKAGQLSKSFSAEDVRRLLRALFQNTERRAAALSVIV